MNKLILMFAFLFIVPLGFSQEQLLYWDFEEGTGSLTLDKSGNDFHGALSGATFDSNSAFGNYAVKFDGTNDNVNALGTHPIPEQISISFWFDITNNNNRILFTIFSENNLIQLEEDANSPTNNLLLHYKDINGNPQSVNIHNTAFNTHQYYHLVLTIDTITQEYRSYINSVLDKSGTLPINISIQDNVNVLRLGEDAENNNEYSGFIDEFRIFSGIVNITQVQSLYTSNTITLDTDNETEIEMNETQSEINGFQSYEIINYTKPTPNSQNPNPVKFEMLLNTQANCELYIDNHLENLYLNVIAGTYEKAFQFNTNHTYFFYCYFDNSEIRYYELQEPMNFSIGGNEKTINFYLYNNQSQLIDSTDLYITTPCLVENAFLPFGANKFTEAINKKNDKYIKKLNNGQASFTLPYTYNYEFCLVRGQINNLYDSYNKDFDIVKVHNQIKLGKINVNNESVNFALVVGDEDLYKMYEPEFWGKTWKSLFNVIITLIIGLPVVVTGLMTKNGKIVIAGVIIIMAGLGVTAGNLVLGALF